KKSVCKYKSLCSKNFISIFPPHFRQVLLAEFSGVDSPLMTNIKIANHTHNTHQITPVTCIDSDDISAARGPRLSNSRTTLVLKFTKNQPSIAKMTRNIMPTTEATHAGIAV